jgi:hypothetical protein
VASTLLCNAPGKPTWQLYYWKLSRILVRVTESQCDRVPKGWDTATPSQQSCSSLRQSVRSNTPPWKSCIDTLEPPPAKK